MVIVTCANPKCGKEFQLKGVRKSLFNRGKQTTFYCTKDCFHQTRSSHLTQEIRQLTLKERAKLRDKERYANDGEYRKKKIEQATLYAIKRREALFGLGYVPKKRGRRPKVEKPAIPYLEQKRQERLALIREALSANPDLLLKQIIELVYPAMKGRHPNVKYYKRVRKLVEEAKQTMDTSPQLA